MINTLISIYSADPGERGEGGRGTAHLSFNSQKLAVAQAAD